MPRYFFDYTDVAAPMDDEGVELPDAEAARVAAIEVLPDVARHLISTGRIGEVAVVVRDEVNRPVFTAAIALTARWLIDNPQQDVGHTIASGVPALTVCRDTRP